MSGGIMNTKKQLSRREEKREEERIAKIQEQYRNLQEGSPEYKKLMDEINGDAKSDALVLSVVDAANNLVSERPGQPVILSSSFFLLQLKQLGVNWEHLTEDDFDSAKSKLDSDDFIVYCTKKARAMAHTCLSKLRTLWTARIANIKKRNEIELGFQRKVMPQPVALQKAAIKKAQQDALAKVKKGE